MNKEDHCDYLIIGGGLAGGHAAGSIRKIDGSGRIVLVSSERFLPYDRVPLSKGYLVDKIPREQLFFRKDDSYAKDKVELIIGREVKEIHVSQRTVMLDNRQELSFQKLLFATGGYPKKIPIPGSDLEGVYYLRTIDQCEALKEGLSKSNSAVIIGGGFIGCELASAFVTKGLETTIIEMGPYLLNMALDEETGRFIENYHSRRGVKILCNSTASRLIGEEGYVKGIELKDGRVLNADLVVVAVGIGLHTDLAEQAGVKVDRGIVVNEFLETNIEDIYAAGDVARFYSPLFKRHLRLEHYDVAVKHGQIAGENMAGQKKKAFAELPYFFSYQYDLKINAYGDLTSRTKIVSKQNGSNLNDGFLQFYLNNDGVVDAILSINSKWSSLKEARELILQRKKL
jgi:3-phenylpropionate/trans-cinnamate dioxygenase ferredoxin reductase subunit